MPKLPIESDNNITKIHYWRIVEIEGDGLTYDDPKNDYLENSYDLDYPDFDEDYIDSERNTAEGARTKNHSNRENNNLVTVLTFINNLQHNII